MQEIDSFFYIDQTAWMGHLWLLFRAPEALKQSIGPMPWALPQKTPSSSSGTY